jgi:galactose mutarotase-like enzyme
MSFLQDGPFRLYELTHESDSLRICPERGALVTSWRRQGKELLYLDRGTFLDPASSVRGGIPVLFPLCGPVKDDHYELDGQTYTLKQHGFARKLPWTVVEQSQNVLGLELKSNPETRAGFPFDFKLRFRFVLESGALRIEQHYSNRSASPMPIQFGFHPYFQTDKKGVLVTVPASRYRDNNAGGAESSFSGTLDFALDGPPLERGNAESTDLEFTDVRSGASAIHFSGDPRKIELQAPLADFPYVVFWTLKDKDFVCLEPWSGPRYGMNSGKDLRFVGPGEELATWIALRVS